MIGWAEALFVIFFMMQVILHSYRTTKWMMPKNTNLQWKKCFLFLVVPHNFSGEVDLFLSSIQS